MQGFPLPPGPPTGAEPSSIVSPNHPYGYGTPQPTPGGPNTNNQRYHEEVLSSLLALNTIKGQGSLLDPN